MLRQFSHSEEATCRELRLGTVLDCQQIYNTRTGTTYVLSNSGSCSSLASLLPKGRSTKLTLTVGIGGILFTSRYSSSQNGITSSSKRASCPVLDIGPLYSVVHPEADSSDINIEVCGGTPTVGASLDIGGLSGLESRTCRGVFGRIGGWLSCKPQSYVRGQLCVCIPLTFACRALSVAAPGVPGPSDACRFGVLPNAFSRPISPPPGVVGTGVAGSPGLDRVAGAPQLAKSSGEGGTPGVVADTEGRLDFSEK